MFFTVYLVANNTELLICFFFNEKVRYFIVIMDMKDCKSSRGYYILFLKSMIKDFLKKI
jgi:hypothetical protein